MALVLNDKKNNKSLVDLGFEEMLEVVDKDHTYEAVIEYWKFCKFVYNDTKKDKFIETKEIVSNILPLLNNNLYYNWHSKSLLIGNRPSDEVFINNVDDSMFSFKNTLYIYEKRIFSDIKMNLFFSNNSFYTKLMKKENNIKEDILEIKKYLKKNLKNKIKNMRANVIKKQAANEISLEHMDLVNIVKNYRPRSNNSLSKDERVIYMLLRSAESNAHMKDALEKLNINIPKYDRVDSNSPNTYYGKSTDIMIWYALNSNEEIVYNSNPLMMYHTIKELGVIFNSLSSGVKVNIFNEEANTVNGYSIAVDETVKLFSKGISTLEELEQNLIVNTDIQSTILSIVDNASSSFLDKKVATYLNNLKHKNIIP